MRDVHHPAPAHLPCLDGLRGWAAFAVVVAHVQILSNCRSLPFDWIGGRAVDLFLLLSGYLLTYHYYRRCDTAAWRTPGAWGRFWVQRYFRIAPAYYVMITLATLLTPVYIWARSYLAAVWPGIFHEAIRYQEASISSYLSHISFYFVFQPVHKVSTVIPDWTVALEIQFYLIFPVLMLLFERRAAIAGALLVGAGWMMLYARPFEPDLGFVLILLKSLHLVVIGIWCAEGNQRRQQGRFALLSVAVVVMSVPFDGLTVAAQRLLCVLFFFYLVDRGGLPRPERVAKLAEGIKLFLGSRFSARLGATSYGVYLCHMLLLLPVASLLAHSEAYVNADDRLRFMLCLLIIIFPVYACAGLVHRLVEQPGIRFGKFLSQPGKRSHALSDR